MLEPILDLFVKDTNSKVSIHKTLQPFYIPTLHFFEMSEYMVAVIGGGAVGKTALIVRFIQGYFMEEYDPTIEDYYKFSTVVDCQDVQLTIIDTADQDPCSPLPLHNVRKAHGFILVYAIDDHETFEQVESLYQQLLRIRDVESVPVVICGNKCDREDLRCVSKREGEELAERLHVTVLETSAKSNIHVSDAFSVLVREMRKAT